MSDAVLASDTHFAQQKTYVCTASAMAGGFCTEAEMGRFILDLPSGKYINSTSFWTARVQLPANQTARSSAASGVSSSGFWDNPDGNPTPPPGNYSSPWRRADNIYNPSPDGLYSYSEPIQYLVRKTGYYCVGEDSIVSLKSRCFSRFM